MKKLLLISVCIFPFIIDSQFSINAKNATEMRDVNGSEIPPTSRKFTIPKYCDVAATMVTSINTNITDNVNPSTSAQTISYTLKAYLENANTPVSYYYD